MASAGRILIMPKGNYDSSVTYEMLDLVGHNGKVWLAKKTTKGIEPSVANKEFWMDMLDLTQVNLDEVGIMSCTGGRESTFKGNQFFFAGGRGRVYHSESPHTATMIIQTNDSATEMDKNASAWDIRRDLPLATRYGILEYDENGNSNRYAVYGTHNIPKATDIIGLREFILQIIAEG